MVMALIVEDKDNIRSGTLYFPWTVLFSRGFGWWIFSET
jgi:hypothetical protein